MDGFSSNDHDERDDHSIAKVFGPDAAPNAALIAEAPAMLALLERIERLSSSPMQRDYVAPEVQSEARAILARVKQS